MYSGLNRGCEAVGLSLQCIEIQRNAVGDDHPMLATSLNNLAEVCRAMGHYDEAEPFYIRALEIISEHVGQRQSRICDHAGKLRYAVRPDVPPRGGRPSDAASRWSFAALVSATIIQRPRERGTTTTLSWRNKVRSNPYRGSPGPTNRRAA